MLKTKDINKKKKLAQASVEYLIILTVAAMFLIPIIKLFYISAVDSNNASNSNLAILSAREIVSNAQKVYYQGKNSKLKLDLTFPENLENISIGDAGNSLIVKSNFEGMSTDFVFFSEVNLTMGTCEVPTKTSPNTDILTQGRKQIMVKSCGKYVVIYDIS